MLDKAEDRADPRRGATWRDLTRRDWGTIVLGAVAVAIAVGLISFLVPARYQASAVVAIRATGGSVNSSLSQTVQASNDLASQYAQLVSNSPGGDKGVAVDGRPPVSASVVANQNLLQLSSQSGSQSEAVDAVRAVTASLLANVQAQKKATQQQSALSLSSVTSSLDKQIATARKQAAATAARAESTNAQPGSALLLRLSNQNDQVTSLLNQRATLQASAASDLAGTGYTAVVVRPASQATRTGPSLQVEVLAGLVVGALVVGLVVRKRRASLGA